MNGSIQKMDNWIDYCAIVYLNIFRVNGFNDFQFVKIIIGRGEI